MLWFIKAGGFPMIIIGILGIAGLVTAVNFARAADPQRLALVRALTWALVFAAISGVASDFMSTCLHVVHDPDMSENPLLPLLQGFGESMAPAVFAASFGSIIWILVAVGVRRMPADHT